MTEFEKWWNQTELSKSIFNEDALLINTGDDYLFKDGAEEIFEDIKNFLSGESK